MNYSCIGLIGILRNEPSLHKPDITSFKCHFKNRTLRILNNISGLTRLNKIVKDETVEAVHFLDIEILLLYIFVRCHLLGLKGIRVVITQHSVNRIRTDRKSLFHRFYRALIHHAYNYLEKNLDLLVLTNGLHITSELTTKGFLAEKSVITAWWGSKYDSSLYATQKKKTNSFLVYGILRKDKNLDFLFHNFSKLSHPYTLHIAGYPRDYSREQLESLIAKYQIPADQIVLELDYLPEERVAALLSTSQYILLPYSSDNLSNSGPMIDAIQFDCIPIASGYGERLEFIRKFGLGLLFYYDSSPTLFDVLEKCQNDDHPVREISSLIKERKRQFTWANIISDLINQKKIYSPG